MRAIASSTRPIVPIREALVTKVEGSAPISVGGSMCLLEDGSFTGTVGGGHMEYHTQSILKSSVPSGETTFLNFTLGVAGDQCCGGRVEIRIVEIPIYLAELYQSGGSRIYRVDEFGRLQIVGGVTCAGRHIGPPGALAFLSEVWDVGFFENGQWFLMPCLQCQPLWIFGAGHVGRAMAAMACHLDFTVSVYDDRPEWADPTVFPPEVKINGSWSWTDMPEPVAGAAVVIMTYSHAMDYHLLEYFIQKPLGYLGVIASRSKAARFTHALSRNGQSLPEFAHIPMGLPGIGKKPAEIAISVLAELLRLRQQGSTLSK